LRFACLSSARAGFRRVVLAILTLALCLPALPSASGISAATDLPVYTDALASGWTASYSWGAAIVLANSSPVHSGSASIAATINDTQWGGLYLHTDAALSASGYTAVRFWVHGGSAGGQQISFKVIDSGDGNWDSYYTVTPTAGTWRQITVTLAALGGPADIAGLVWQDASGQAQPTFYVDDITLVSGTTPPPPAGLGPALSVDAAADQHAISPYIYGMNFADENLAQELHLPVRRWGGNSTSRYNYQNNTYNTGSDWYFENISGGTSADAFVNQDRRTQTKTLLTMPLIGWVSKDSPANHPFYCGFNRSKFPSQDAFDPWDNACGNGQLNGANLTGNDPTDTSVAITQAFDSGWVSHLISLFKTADQGGVMFYDLDNEPMLWNSTHRDVHPAATTYDEMRTRTYDYAAAIKAADPAAQTLGPVVWGWCAYFYSAKDGCSPGSDRAAHNNTDFAEWYLQQMRSYEQTHGIRILDYVDVHAYPQANGIFSDNPGSAAVQALRLRSTRQLWDLTYVDESWIGQPVYLIPRMRAWVANDYPGTKTAITEYNWGALGYLNGALAQADVLGIFGREGLDLATLWGPPTTAQPGAYAFRMYLNYDGLGHRFGETSVRAVSADQGLLSLYGARRSSDGALTLMIINKTSSPLTSTVTISNFVPALSAEVYRYDAGNLQAIVRQPDQALGGNGFTAVFPANSITLMVVLPTLKLGKSVWPAQHVAYGDPITYTLTLADQQRTAQLLDPLPVGVTYVPGSLSPVSPAAAYDSMARAITWQGLVPTAGLTITFQALVMGSPAGRLAPTLSNTAALTDTVSGRSALAAATLNSHLTYVPLIQR